MLEAVSRHEFLINGLRNRDVRALLYGSTAATAAEQKRLEGQGVKFTRTAGRWTWRWGAGVISTFRDPDGNQLVLHHRYAPRSASPTRAE